MDRLVPDLGTVRAALASYVGTHADGPTPIRPVW
ncbi:hypothetical protein J2S43_002759 [Catenuloplanes nepalensis]|uniref:Uncharacterized protein n=1 Tax=Catenuloplanes nepalensis TaxID=587533 RepID=A0ABT9MS32_9ACTN|nr:hypothetical protein [Catenuloplanes nepalensis]